MDKRFIRNGFTILIIMAMLGYVLGWFVAITTDESYSFDLRDGSVIYSRSFRIKDKYRFDPNIDYSTKCHFFYGWIMDWAEVSSSPINESKREKVLAVAREYQRQAPASFSSGYVDYRNNQISYFSDSNPFFYVHKVDMKSPITGQQVDSAEASTIAVPPSEPPGSPR